MKKTIVNFVILCSFGLITACSTTTIDERPIDNYAIDFSSTTSRAAIQDDFPQGSSFSVWGWYVNQNLQTNNVFDNTEVKLTESGWGYIGTQYWNPNSTYSFYAVHPSKIGSVSSDGVVKIEGFDCSATGDNAVDLMTATSANISYTGGTMDPVNLEFAHELSSIKFNVKVQDGLSATVTEAKLYGVNYKGDYDSSKNPVWQNTIINNANDTKFIYSPENPQPLTAEGIPNIFSDILIIPNDDIENVVFQLTYYYDEYSEMPLVKNIAVKQTNIPSWLKGQVYNYTATIGPNNIQFKPVVTPWGQSTGGIITVE